MKYLYTILFSFLLSTNTAFASSCSGFDFFDNYRYAEFAVKGHVTNIDVLDYMSNGDKGNKKIEFSVIDWIKGAGDNKINFLAHAPIKVETNNQYIFLLSDRNKMKLYSGEKRRFPELNYSVIDTRCGGESYVQIIK